MGNLMIPMCDVLKYIHPSCTAKRASDWFSIYYTSFTEQASIDITLQTRTREVLASNLSLDISYPERIFEVLLSLQAISGIVPHILSISSPIDHSIILPCDTTYSCPQNIASSLKYE
jgi:hypothetical protein